MDADVRAEDAPRKGAGAGGRLEPWLLLLLMLGVVVAWSVQWQPFLLPNNDYYSFERTARSFAAGELPGSFKRMPVLPALVALVAPWLSGSHPWLQAGLLVNAAFSLGVLALLYRFAADTIGRGAVLVPVLFATSAQFHYNGLQALVEPSLGFFVIAAFVLQRRRSAWKWAAAFAAALSRYEAALVIPVLCVADWVETRRFWRPALLAAAASSGVVVWTLLGTLQGAGGGWYLELMEGMGFQPAPGFFLRQLEEPFAGWYLPGARGVPVLIAVVLAPLALGIVEGLRRFRVDAAALLAFWGLCVSLIVVFGVDKARYVYPTQWIPLVFWTLGILRGVPWAARWLAARSAARRRAALVATVLAGLAAAGLWLERIASQPVLHTPWLELVLAVPALAAVAVVLRRAAWPPPAGRVPRAAVGLAAGIAFGVAVAGGLAGRQREIFDMYWDNAGAWVLAPWLEVRLAEGGRAAVLPVSHVLFLTDLSRDDLVPFFSFEARDAAGLAAEMRARGVRFAAWTHRGGIRKPEHRYYYRATRQDLAELFREGGPVPGFEHVATLRVPEVAEETDVQIYRLAEPSG
ncbi:MAG: hypothetical protein R3263_04555 [Myxococcota bacterium]|nr:hypothetical protein [Myxococcota bacterium]